MPVSRPLLIALLATVLAGGAFLLTRASGGEPSEAASLTPAAPAEGGISQSPLDPAAPSPGAASPPAGSSAPSSEAGARAAAAPDADSEPPAGLPREVVQAIERGRVAVLYQPGGADDEATVANVRELEDARSESPRLRRQTAVFTDRLSNAADYLGVTSSLGVSQAPAVIMLSRNGPATLLEGYTDGRSLRQYLADALDGTR